MARDKGSRPLLKFWCVLAFTVGAAAGALSLEFLQPQSTVWLIVFLGAISAAVAIFEQFGDPRGRNLRPPIYPPRWSGRHQANLPMPPHKQASGKHPPRRARLHAITGKKNAEPPSSGAS